MTVATLTASTKKEAPTKTLRNFLEQYKGQIEAALPKHMNADRMCRLVMTAVSQTPKLQECDIKSIFAAVIVSSQLGLEIGVGGQGYLVPYKRKATFVPGWQGLVDLVSRAGRATVWTGSVFEGDEFDYAQGDSPFVKHKAKGEEDPKKLLYTYAIGRVNGSQWPIVEVWPVEKIIKHRDKHNKVGEDHYSYKHWEMYARKIPLLQVLKYMPKSVELVHALHTESTYSLGKGTTIDGDFVNLGDEPETPELEGKSEGPSLLDEAIAHVKKGNIDLAQDLARNFSPEDKKKFDAHLFEARPPKAPQP